jgi:antitoxin component of MazEF toxin-antitoxin module
MSTRKRKEKHIRKLTRLGGSLVVSIPVEDIDTLNWREKQKVVVKRDGKKITIKDWRP